MTAVDIIPRSLSFEGGSFNSLLQPPYMVEANNVYTPDPTMIVCLLENGLVVEVEISTSTTFAQLNDQALSLARQSPLYSPADFENVEFTLIYFTQLGEEKHGQPNEKILTVLYDSDVTEMGPLLSLIKFERKSSGWDEYSRLASVLHCDVEDIRSFVDVPSIGPELKESPLRCLKEIEVEVQHFRRSARIIALDSLRERVKTVQKESPICKKHMFLKTVVPLHLQQAAIAPSTASGAAAKKPPKIDSALYAYLSQSERNVELLHDEGGAVSERGGNNTQTTFTPAPLLAVIQDVNYLTASVSQILAKAIPLTCEGNSSENKFVTNALSKNHITPMSQTAQQLIRNSKYILKVFGSEIYFTEDVLFIEVPEIVDQLTKSFYDPSVSLSGQSGGHQAKLRLVLCDKQRIVDKYNYSQFQESCLKSTELTSAKKEMEKLNDKQEKLLRKQETVSLSSLSNNERYYFHPTAVMLGDEVEAELRGDNYWIIVTCFLTFGDTIITSFTFPIKRKKEALWGSQDEIDVGKTQIAVHSLPRSATLCFIVYIAKTDRPSRYDYVKKFWANFCIFDFCGYLKTGSNNLHLWELPQDQVMIYQPNLTGTTIDNLKTFQKKKSFGVRLIINCMAGLHNSKVSYHFETPLQQGLNVQWLNNITLQNHIKLTDISSIDDMSAAEKAWIFKQAVEYYYQKVSNSDNIFSTHKLLQWLPQIVKCVEFSDADMVQNLKLLLHKCKPPEFVLKTDQCLVLLGFHCQDLEVRNFAVEHLNQKSVSELKSYLLQICECLKFERYLCNQLTFMLLRKCFHDHTFAHALFWNLRIFLFDETHWLRTSLIIEALFSGIPDYRHLLEKPLQIVEKMRIINSQLKKLDSTSTEKQQFMLKEYLHDNLSLMDQWLCPLCPSKFLSSLEPNESKCMKSKMKPIRLVYNTEDFVIRSEDAASPSLSPLTSSAVLSWDTCKKGLGPAACGDLSYELMFKIGDDLRQDVLMLQMFSCFNTLWIQRDLDLKLLSYKCVAAEVDAGFIEMVQDASTISKIQKWYNNEKKMTFGAVSAAWSKDAIYLWLASDITKNNKLLPEEFVKKAVEEFVLSCAGSCVASYVLGIGDRHNDNIMVHRSGRLFHIDFGHILGRKKQKFGINRERVPLILPASFMYIINRDFESNDASKPEYRKNFEYFRDLCVRAFLVLRENVDMICNMLYVMKDAGMPELKSIDDVNYVRETLFTSESVEEAEKKFIQKINESIKSSWTTNVNWAFHNRQHWR